MESVTSVPLSSALNSVNVNSNEKRSRPSTVINRIRKFARSQSQLRSQSRNRDRDKEPTTSANNHENIVTRTKDLYKDVKRRLQLNIETISRRPSSEQSEDTLKNLLSKEITRKISGRSGARLRRFNSDESLQTSESGCGSSIKTSSLSTDSNRSSICTDDYVTGLSGSSKCPFVGQGTALIDCTPCPYDKDALVFKKGDIIQIISKNDTGTWIGMANGKIGHFKFINIEEKAETPTTPLAADITPVEKTVNELYQLKIDEAIIDLLISRGIDTLKRLQSIIDSEEKDEKIIERLSIDCINLRKTITDYLPIMRKFFTDRLTPDIDEINKIDRKMATLRVEVKGEQKPTPIVNSRSEFTLCDISDKICRSQSGNELNTMRIGSCWLSSNVDTDMLCEKLEHGYQNHRDTAVTAQHENGRKRMICSKSFFDLKLVDKIGEENNNISGNSNGGHNNGIYSTRKRLRRFLVHERKSITSIDIDDRPYKSITTLHHTSRHLSQQLLNNIKNLLKQDGIDLTLEPYSDSSGFCGIPPALVQRYAEELESDIYEVADTLDYIRLNALISRNGKQGIPNDFLADSCIGPGMENANYECLESWLISLGLPMYYQNLLSNGHQNLWHLIKLKEEQLVQCGITSKRHLRTLIAAIGALNINQHKIGKG